MAAKMTATKAKKHWHCEGFVRTGCGGKGAKVVDLVRGKKELKEKHETMQKQLDAEIDAGKKKEAETAAKVHKAAEKAAEKVVKEAEKAAKRKNKPKKVGASKAKKTTTTKQHHELSQAEKEKKALAAVKAVMEGKPVKAPKAKTRKK